MRDRTLLVIDDDPLMRFCITAYLEDSGFTCLEAAGGQEGLDLFGRRPADLVVTDLSMPGMDGLEVLARFRALSPATPVVVLTGTTDGTAAEEALGLGAAACLTKPVPKLEMLVTLIDTILAKPFQDEEVRARVRTHLDLRAHRRRLEENNDQLNEAPLGMEQANRKLLEVNERLGPSEKGQP